MTEHSEKTAPSSAPAVSAPARIVGTFFSPVSTFESIAARPGFLLPILLWTAASVLVTAFLLPRIDFDRMIRSSLEKRGQPVPEERIQSIVERQKRMAPVLYNVIGAVSPALICLLVTLVYWASFKAFGWDFGFRQGLGATAHAFLPGVLGAFVLLPIIAQRETIDPTAMGELLRSNLGFLVDKNSSPALHSLLGSLDLFSLWSLILLSIGYAAAARVSKKASAGVVFTLWALYVLGKAGLAALLS
jgi:Yip1 domain